MKSLEEVGRALGSSYADLRPNGLPYPYNVGDKEWLQETVTTSPLLVKGRFVRVRTNAKDATVEVICHCCGHMLQKINMDWGVEEPV